MRIVIVGGGPVGMIVAKGLANRNPGAEIIVLERMQKDAFTPENYRTATSYCFNLSRGHPKLLLELDIWREEDYKDTSASRGGHEKLCYIKYTGPELKDTPSAMRSIFNTTLWIQRLHMLQALHRSLARSSNIDLRFGCALEGMYEQEGKLCIQTVSKHGRGSSRSILVADIVVACDGWKSFVRQCLSEWTESKRFGMVRMRQLSTGMHFKSCLLNLDATFLPSGCMGICQRKQGNSLFGVFEQNASHPRLAGFPRYTIENDPLFKQGLTEQEFRAYLQKEVPSVPWDRALSSEEAEAFCKAGKGIDFPDVSYCKDAVYINKQKSAAVLLCGDTMHAFPPDSGQGLNSGLEDAIRAIEALSVTPALNQPLAEGAQLPEPLLSALQHYEKQTCLEAYAMCHISQVICPWQYSVIPKGLGFYEWLLRNLLEFVGSKLIPELFQPPLMWKVSKPEATPYSELWAGYEINSKLFGLLACVSLPLAAAAGVLIRKRLRT